MSKSVTFRLTLLKISFSNPRNTFQNLREYVMNKGQSYFFMNYSSENFVTNIGEFAGEEIISKKYSLRLYIQLQLALPELISGQYK